MLNLWHDLPCGENPPEIVTAVIEIPSGSRNKYELDKASGMLKLDRVLFSAVHYPGDYGFVPRTLADDDDPLDVLIMVTEPTFPGCLVVVRTVGVFEMSDDKGGDEKILAVPVRDPLYAEYRELEHVPRHYLREVEHFFGMYKELEGVTTKVIGWRDRARAHDLILSARTRYDQTLGIERTTP